VASAAAERPVVSSIGYDMNWWFEFHKLIEVIDGDIVVAEERLRSEDNQPNRRQVVRILLTFVEVMFNRFRTMTAEIVGTRALIQGSVNLHELYPLMDESAEIQSNGHVRLVPKRVPLIRHLAFTIRAHAKHKNIDPTKFFSDNGWSQLQKAIRIRHRLIHPKSVEELEVSDGDIDIVRAGLIWFRDCLQALYSVVDFEVDEKESS
jgi:hypothetical protein